jgi:choice-of-anchor A domain-containing protein
MQFIESLLRSFSAPRRASSQSDLRAQLYLLSLEERANPSGSPVDLGVANEFAVLGLTNTAITNVSSAVVGNLGVSQFGSVTNGRNASITGNVDEFTTGQYSGSGTLTGSIVTNTPPLTQCDSDAISASMTAGGLSPTQTLGAIKTATTVTGNGNVNVINITGDITASLTLSGSASDVFIVNVQGNLVLRNHESISLTGGVTADHVLFNFTNSTGKVISAGGATINGTILALGYNVTLRGAIVNGEIIAGASIDISGGTQVNAIAFVVAPAANASISGFAFIDNNPANLMFDPGETPDGIITVTITNAANTFSMTTQTAADGSYSFTGLAADTYTITFSSSFGETGTAVPGTVSGSPDGTLFNTNTINNIVLTNSSVGVNYNYAVNPPPV